LSDASEDVITAFINTSLWGLTIDLENKVTVCTLEQIFICLWL